MKRTDYKSTVISCYLAYVTQSIVVNFMPVLFIIFQQKYKMPFKDLGSLVLLNFLTQIFADFTGIKIVDKIGFRRSAVPAHILVAVGLILLGILPDLLPNAYIGLVISVILFSFGGGLIEVFTSPIVDFLPNGSNSASMSLLHSFYCWGQVITILVSTVVIKIFGYDSWKSLAICWAFVPILNTINFLRVPLPETQTKKRQPVLSLFKTKKFLICLLLMFSAGAAEITMSQWSSMFAQKGLGIKKVVGDILGPCTFALLMATGRVWYGKKGDRIDTETALLFCGTLGVVCYFVAGTSGSNYLSLAACAITGLSVSIMWPCAMSYTAASFSGGAAMFGVMAVFGDLGCSLGPWLTGIVSDAVKNSPAFFDLAIRKGLEIEQIALKMGLLTGIIFPILLIAGILALRKD